ncbi:hypothetical protein GQ42DRAFT_165787 [Ramicandelaber brevisporus]|nr:hypothetical protein GQ42DRAFT_165787 [Ramicandelaber brevisporus]
MSLLLSVSAAILAAFCHAASAQSDGSESSASSASAWPILPTAPMAGSGSTGPLSSPSSRFSASASSSGSGSASAASRDWSLSTNLGPLVSKALPSSSSRPASSSGVDDIAADPTPPINTTALIASVSAGVLSALIIAIILFWRTRRERRQRVLGAAAESDGSATHETPVNLKIVYNPGDAAAYNVEPRLPQSQPPPYSPKPE